MSASTTATLLLVATIVSSDGSSLQVDAGFANGLRVGDQGQVYYELKVGEAMRQVQVGSARIVELEDFAAVLEGTSEREVRPGYRVRFELPGGRISPVEVIRLAADRFDGDQFDEVMERVIDEMLPFAPDIESRIGRLLEKRRSRRAAASAAKETALAEARRPKSRVAPGVYEIGVSRERATYFNQQPQFDVELDGFEIDRFAVTRDDFGASVPDHVLEAVAAGEPATDLTFAMAEEYCRANSGRLPTEFEWEVAAERGAIEPHEGLLEWTSSWLKAYPGNERPELDYGEHFKVLRGASSSEDPDLHFRRFLDPARSHASVGFRCAYSKGGSGA